MLRITLFKKNSIFIIFLATSVANPLLALPAKNNSTIKRNLRASNISQKIHNILIAKGLEQETAISKTNKLLKSDKNTENKLSSIYNSPNLPISKEKLDETLAKYALYEKNLNLNSYASILGLIQSISLEKLDEKQLKSIKDIASYN